MNVHQFIKSNTERVEDVLETTDLVAKIAASYSLAPEEVPDDDLVPIVLIRPAQALSAIQTLKEWEEQQDYSTHEIVRQLQALEKRIKRVQLEGLQQSTLASYIR
jgi:bifunctional DNase/RNase